MTNRRKVREERSPLTAKILRELLHYDPITGVFRWLPRPSNQRWTKRWAGKVAGRITNKGYLQIRVLLKRHLGHRLAWLYEHGEWPSGDLDHDDRVRHHNWIENLRPATHSNNQHNRSCNAKKANGLKGAYWDKSRNKWLAVIGIKGKYKNLGRYDTAEAAHAAYCAAAHRLHGEFARTS